MRIVKRLTFDEKTAVDVRILAFEFHLVNRSLFVVGGAVRDAILNKEPHDVDFATDLDPDGVIHVLNNMKSTGDIKVIEAGKSFGVIKVIMPSGGEYEIATFRQDIGSGRRPESVSFSTIEVDVLRRDFTMNALFYDVSSGEIVDHVGGLEDIANGIVRCVGDPYARFEEDPLRVMRALRFASSIGYLDGDTREAVKKSSDLKGVSNERIRDEFLKGLRAARSTEEYLDLCDELGMWDAIFPGLQVCTFSLRTRDPIATIAMLLHMNDKKLMMKRLNELKYSAEEVSTISLLCDLMHLSEENAHSLKKRFIQSKIDHKTLRDFVVEAGISGRIIYAAFLQYVPTVTGDELIAEGFSGRELGLELMRREAVHFQQEHEKQKNLSGRR